MEQQDEILGFVLEAAGGLSARMLGLKLPHLSPRQIQRALTRLLNRNELVFVGNKYCAPPPAEPSAPDPKENKCQASGFIAQVPRAKLMGGK